MSVFIERYRSQRRELGWRGVAVTALALASLSGCARHSYCSKPLAYEKAESIPAIAGVDGLEVKSSPSAFIIPPAPANPVPFGVEVNDPERPGRKMWSCLDQPPAFVVTAPQQSVR